MRRVYFSIQRLITQIFWSANAYGQDGCREIDCYSFKSEKRLRDAKGNMAKLKKLGLFKIMGFRVKFNSSILFFMFIFDRKQHFALYSAE